MFVRYVLDDPTAWAFDMSYILYGGLFPDVRRVCVVAERACKCRRAQSAVAAAVGNVELVLYFIFFFPGVTALIIAGLRLRA